MLRGLIAALVLAAPAAADPMTPLPVPFAEHRVVGFTSSAGYRPTVASPGENLEDAHADCRATHGSAARVCHFYEFMLSPGIIDLTFASLLVTYGRTEPLPSDDCGGWKGGGDGYLLILSDLTMSELDCFTPVNSGAACCAPTPVPEPHAWLVQGTGAVALVALARLRRS